MTMSSQLYTQKVVVFHLLNHVYELPLNQTMEFCADPIHERVHRRPFCTGRIPSWWKRKFEFVEGDPQQTKLLINHQLRQKPLTWQIGPAIKGVLLSANRLPITSYHIPHRPHDRQIYVMVMYKSLLANGRWFG